MEADLDAMCAAFGDESDDTNSTAAAAAGLNGSESAAAAEATHEKADALRARVRTLALRVMASSSASSASASASSSTSAPAASAPLSGGAETETEFAQLQADVLAHYERHRAAAECGRASVRHALDEMSARFKELRVCVDAQTAARTREVEALRKYAAGRFSRTFSFFDFCAECFACGRCILHMWFFIFSISVSLEFSVTHNKNCVFSSTSHLTSASSLSLRYNKRLQAGMASAVKSPAARGMQSPARLLGTPGSSSSTCDDLSASSQAADAKQSLRRVQQFLDRFNAKH
jgi:hypothetical protein